MFEEDAGVKRFDWSVKNVFMWAVLVLIVGFALFVVVDTIIKASNKPAPVSLVRSYFRCPEGESVTFMSNEFLYELRPGVSQSYSYGLKGGSSSTRVVDVYTGVSGRVLTLTGKGGVVLDSTDGVITYDVTVCEVW